MVCPCDVNKGHQRLQARLDEACEEQHEHAGATNGTHISTIDPDSSVVRRGGGSAVGRRVAVLRSKASTDQVIRKKWLT